MNADSRATGYVTLAVVALALLVRLPGLHLLPLHGDEDISTLVARGILETGAPRLPSGSLYARAPIFHYAIAPLVAAGIDWLPRLLSVLCSVVTTWLIARLGRRFVGEAAALAGAALFAISLPEIVVARTIRMYAAYELVAFLALVVLFRLWQRRTLAWALSATLILAVSGLVHQLGVTLAALLPLAAFRHGMSVAARIACVSGAVVIVGLGGAYRVFSKAAIKVGQRVIEPATAHEVPAIDATFRAWIADAPFGFGRTVGAFPILVAAAALAGVGLALWATRGMHPARRAGVVLALAACTGAAGAHQIGTAICLLAGLVILRGELLPDAAGRRALAAAGAFVAVAAAAWTLAVVASGYALPDAVAGLTRWPLRLARTHLWPPGIALFAAAGAVVVLGRSLSLRAAVGERFVLLVVLVLTAARGLLTGRSADRYLVDTGPMWVLLAGLGLVVGWRAIAGDRLTGAMRRRARTGATLAVACLLLVLPGTGVRTLAAYLSLRAGERPSVERVSGVPDYRAAAAWLLPRLDAADRVVATNWLTAHAYLGRVDGWVRWRRFAGQSTIRGGAVRDVYLGARVLSDLDALTGYLDGGGTPAWLLAGGPELAPAVALVAPEVRHWLGERAAAWTSPAGDLRIYRLRPGDARGGPPVESLSP